MSELTPEQTSMGVFAIAAAISQLQPGLENVEREIDDKRAERAAIEQSIAQARAYDLALAQHVEEMEARLADLRSGTPVAARDLEERLTSMRAAVNGLQDEQARVQYAIGESHRQLGDAREEVRHMSEQARALGNLPSVALQRQLGQWQVRCQGLQDEVQRLQDEAQHLRQQLRDTTEEATDGDDGL